VSNFLVARGLGANLVPTRGLGSAGFAGGGKALIFIKGNKFRVDVKKKQDGYAYIFISDMHHSFQAKLPMSDAQLMGMDWAIIKVVRSGSSIIVTMDREIIATFSLSTILSYTGQVIMGRLKQDALFDVRTLPRVISKESSDYYRDDIDQNTGNAELPLYGNHSATPETRPDFNMPPGGTGPDSAAGVSTIYMHGGTLKIDVYKSGGLAYVRWNDGSNDHTVQLPMTADQLAGNSWATIAVQRQSVGTSEVLNVYLDKTLVTSITLGTHKTYGGKVNIMRGKEDSIFDVRVVPRAVSDSSISYYQDSVVQETGNALLPKKA